MNVGELKEMLNSYPDDMEIITERYSDDPCKRAYTEEYDRETRREEERRQERMEEEREEERYYAEQQEQQCAPGEFPEQTEVKMESAHQPAGTDSGT